MSDIRSKSCRAAWRRAALMLLATAIFFAAGSVAAAQSSAEQPTPSASPVIVLDSQQNDDLAPDSDVVLRVGFVAAMALGLGGLAILDRKPSQDDREDDFG